MHNVCYASVKVVSKAKYRLPFIFRHGSPTYWFLSGKVTVAKHKSWLFSVSVCVRGCLVQHAKWLCLQAVTGSCFHRCKEFHSIFSVYF